jgi:endonuclease/exonuclease/phosphatase family metal-dependent hydrolase
VIVATWNMLHGVHARNWNEAPVLARYPDEGERIAACTEVFRRIAAASEVVAMQEVSGDQMAAVREALPAGWTLHSHRYPRVPRMRDGSACPLREPTEYLVIAVRGEPASVRKETSASDPGKGLLAVDVALGGGSMRVLSVHTGKGEEGADQLARAYAVAAEREIAVILGDLNALPETVARGLPPGFALAAPSPGGFTRGPDGDRPGRWIDHGIAKGGAIEVIEVIDAERCSDHQPVRFSFSRP